MDATEFLTTEAALLDDRRYEAWGELFTSDCRYWAPYDWNSTSPRSSVNIIYDDQHRLQDRIARLVGGDMHAQDPPVAHQSVARATDPDRSLGMEPQRPLRRDLGRTVPAFRAAS